MAKRTLDELKASIQALAGDSIEDGYISLLEDIEDTLRDIPAEDGKAALEEANAKINALTSDLDTWKRKYRDRFFGKKDDEEIEERRGRSDEEPEGMDYDSLFLAKED